MKLNLQQIQAITQGAETIREEGGMIRFCRFTDEELALYKARPDYYPTAICTANIQMLFRTDAESLYLKFTAPEGKLYSPFFAYDILVDDKLIGQLKNFPDEMKNGHYYDAPLEKGAPEGSFSLGSGIKTVRIVFPWSVCLKMESCILENATILEPVKKEKKLLIYGDSITQGSCCLYPSQTYPSLLGRWLDADTTNKGVGSEFYYPELAEQKLPYAPDYITVAYGINDWGHCTKEQYRNNCRNFWSAICKNYPNAKKFALTPIWYMNWAEVAPFGPFEELKQVIAEVAQEFPDVVVLDGTDFVSRDTADFGDLYIHPNHIGFRLFFENLKKAMMPYL